MDVPAQSPASQPGPNRSDDESGGGSGAEPRDRYRAVPGGVRSARARLLFALLRGLTLVALFGTIVVAYLFFVTAGTFDNWPTYNINFDMQAEGFRAGHLHLSATPPPELALAEDPYSPENSRYWARDLTLYRGQYYLYWGPLPALALAAVKTVFRIQRVVGDQFLLFSFDVLQLLVGVLLIDRMARRLFPAAPFALTIAGILVLAFANPTPYLLSTAGVYQTAIVGGQAFVLTGLLLAFNAFWPTPGRERAGRGALLGAGICWAMALACRVSLGPPILALSCLTLLASWRGGTKQPWNRRALDAVWLVGPIAIGIGLLLLYNKLRFHAWFEFGQRFQLNDPELKFHISLSYLVPNIYSYLLRPIVRSCHFPFVRTIWDLGTRAFPRGFKLPRGYMVAEPVAGILLSMPWSWLAPVGVWSGLRLARTARRAPGGLLAADSVTRAKIFLVFSFAVMATLTALTWVAVFSTTMRYLADVEPGITLCGLVGAWWLADRAGELRDARTARWLRLLLVVVFVALAGFTIAVGGLLGFTGYIEHFKLFNPDLLDRLRGSLSVCR